MGDLEGLERQLVAAVDALADKAEYQCKYGISKSYAKLALHWFRKIMKEEAKRENELSVA